MGVGGGWGGEHRKGLLVDSVVCYAATPPHAFLHAQDELYQQMEKSKPFTAHTNLNIP